MIKSDKAVRKEKAVGVIDRFERAVSQGVNAPFHKNSVPLKAVDLAALLREEVENNRATLSGGRIVVPNEFEMRLPEANLSTLISETPQLPQELAQAVTDYAVEQEFVFVGPVEVTLVPVSDIPMGESVIKAQIRRGPAAPVTNAEASPAHPIIDIEGQQWLLTEPITVIGRGSEADIVVQDPGVSRKHLELRITQAGVIATDLGSTNGSYVEGHRIDAATLLDGNEITIGRTHILFWTSNAGSYSY